jgi:hypothetical protein
MRWMCLFICCMTLIGCGSTGKTPPPRDDAVTRLPPEIFRLPQPETVVTAKPPMVTCNEGVEAGRRLGSNFERWQVCSVAPVERYASSPRLTAFWKGEACFEGKAFGHGNTAWCNSGDCDPTNKDDRRVIIRATGTAIDGELTSCPIRIATPNTVFRGGLTKSGEYLVGHVTQTSSFDSKLQLEFIGRFRQGNNPESGAYRFKGKTYITSNIDNKTTLPKGETLVIEGAGTATLMRCEGFECKAIEASLRIDKSDIALVERYFFSGAVSGAEVEFVRQLLTKHFPRLARGPFFAGLIYGLEFLATRANRPDAPR